MMTGMKNVFALAFVLLCHAAHTDSFIEGIWRVTYFRTGEEWCWIFKDRSITVYTVSRLKRIFIKDETEYHYSIKEQEGKTLFVFEYDHSAPITFLNDDMFTITFDDKEEEYLEGQKLSERTELMYFNWRMWEGARPRWAPGTRPQTF